MSFYKNSRPVLTIEATGGQSLGRCYSSHTLRVTSLHRLTLARLKALREAGFLGYGQEFRVFSQCDGKEEPAGYDTVPCVNADGSAALDKSGHPYKPLQSPYWVYEVENRVDSSD